MTRALIRGLIKNFECCSPTHDYSSIRIIHRMHKNWYIVGNPKKYKNCAIGWQEFELHLVTIGDLLE